MGKYSSFWFRVRKKNVSSFVKAGCFHKLRNKAKERLKNSAVDLLSVVKVKRTRLYRGRVIVGGTWQHYLDDPLYRDPGHYKGREFRTRFRVPFDIFQRIVSICRTTSSFEDEEKLWYDKKDLDCCGQKTWPLEILVLGKN